MPAWAPFRITSTVAINGYLGVRRRSSPTKFPREFVAESSPLLNLLWRKLRQKSGEEGTESGASVNKQEGLGKIYAKKRTLVLFKFFWVMPMIPVCPISTSASRTRRTRGCCARCFRFTSAKKRSEERRVGKESR